MIFAIYLLGMFILTVGSIGLCGLIWYRNTVLKYMPEEQVQSAKTFGWWMVVIGSAMVMSVIAHYAFLGN